MFDRIRMWFWHRSHSKVRENSQQFCQHLDSSFSVKHSSMSFGSFSDMDINGFFRCINSPSNLGLCSLGTPDVLLQFPWMETRSAAGCSRAVCWESSHFETCKLVWVVFPGPRCGLPSAPASRFWKGPRAKPKVMHGYVWGSRIPVFRYGVISWFFCEACFLSTLRS